MGSIKICASAAGYALYHRNIEEVFETLLHFVS